MQFRTQFRTMRIFAAAAFFAVTIAGNSAARADQDDPRLDTLFEALTDAEGAGPAGAISETIWRIWFSIEDEAHQAIMNEARLAMATNRLTEALNLFSRLTQLAPEYAEAHNRRATVNFLLGNLDQSLEDIEETLALESRHFGALSGRAQIELIRGNQRAALEALEAAAEVYPLMPGIQDQIEELRIKVEGVPI